MAIKVKLKEPEILRLKSTTGGTVKEVNSGDGLTGGPITLSGTLSVLANTGLIANSSGLFVNTAYISTVDSNTVGGNTAQDLLTYSDNKAGEAYSNSVSYTDTKAGEAYSNAISYTDTKAGEAYSNSVSYTDTKAGEAYSNAVSYTDIKAGEAYSNAVSYTDTKAGEAYSNAVSFSSNASNISTGTLSTSLLEDSGVVADTYGNSSTIPVLTVDEKGRVTNISTADVAGVENFTYESTNNTITLTTGDGTLFNVSLDTVNNFIVTGNLTVTGQQTYIQSNTVLFDDNMLRLNAGLSTPTPDIGFVGFYSDDKGIEWNGDTITWGDKFVSWNISNAYTGIFRDASDGIWKVFESYAPNPDNDYDIDINDSTFKIADFQTDRLYVGSISANGNIGTPGQVLHSNGSSVYWGPDDNDLTFAAGSNTQIQFNNSGSLSGSAGFTFNNTTNTVFVANSIGIGTSNPSAKISVSETTSLTDTYKDFLIMNHTTTGIPSGNFGSRILFKASRTQNGDPADYSAIRTSYGGSSVSGSHPSLFFQVGYNGNDLDDVIEIYREQEGNTPPTMKFIGDDGRIVGVNTFRTANNQGQYQVGSVNASLIAKTTWVPALSGYFGVSFKNSNLDTYPIEFDWTNQKVTIDNTLNVGIGTTSPDNALEVKRDSGSTDSPVAAFYGGGSNGDQSYIRVGGGPLNYIVLGHNNGSGGPGAYGFLSTSGNGIGTKAITWDANGNVGIGTSSPASKLDVVGLITGDGITSSNVITVQDTSTRYGEIDHGGSISYFTSRYDSADGGFIFRSYNGTAYTNRFKIETNGDLLGYDTSNNIKLVWDASSEALGIGTTTLDAKLFVTGSINPGYVAKFVNTGDSTNALGLLIQAGTNNGFGDSKLVSFAYGGTEAGFISNGLGVLTYAGTAGLKFRTNSLDRLSITSSGDVGIGTTSPSAKLDVTGSINPGYVAKFVNTGDSTNALGLLIQAGTNNGFGDSKLVSFSYGGNEAGFISNSVGVLTYAGTTGLKFRTNSLDRLSITSSGDVGIGTTSPISKLHTIGEILVGQPDFVTPSDGSIRVHSDDASYGQIGFTNRYNNFTSGMRSYGYGLYGRDLRFYTRGLGASASNGDEIARFDVDGNFGIGTTSPTSKLTVDGSTLVDDLAVLSVRRSDITSRQINLKPSYFANSLLSGIIEFSGLTNGMFSGASYYQFTGPLLIGAAKNSGMNPNTDGNTRLHIVDGVGTQPDWNYSPHIIVQNNLNTSDRTAISLLSGNNSLGDIVFADADRAAEGIIRYDHSSNKMGFYTSLGERLVIDSSGNVGIGTTSPSYKLDIIQSSGVSTFRLGSDTTNYMYIDSGGVETHIYSVGERPFKLATYVNTNQLVLASSGRVGIGTSEPDATLTVNGTGRFGTGSVNSNIGIYNNSNNKTVSIDSNGNSYFIGGNVGIGTASPTEKLHIDGSSARILLDANGTGGGFFLQSYNVDIGRIHAPSGGNLGIFATNGIEIDAGGSEKMRITSSGNVGIGTTEPDTYGKLAVAGNVMPAGDASYDLGSPTYRWNNVYTTDLHLSNENKPGGNDVDGTTGNWTLQEGADAIYMINNITGKKYKIALEEVK